MKHYLVSQIWLFFHKDNATAEIALNSGSKSLYVLAISLTELRGYCNSV